MTNNTRIDVFNGKPSSNIRGGGIGNYGAWIARITGVGGQYGLEREFCKKDTSGVSGSGKSGYIAFDATEPGVYEYRKLGSSHVNSKTEINGFFVIDVDGNMTEISREQVVEFLN